MCAWLIAGVFCGSVLAGAASSEERSQPWRFVLDSKKRIDFVGLITVDGVTRVVTGRTPFEFECERASAISGYFEVGADEPRLRLRVFDPLDKKTVPAWARAHRILFSWGKPGVPRCLGDVSDSGADVEFCSGFSSGAELQAELRRLLAAPGAAP